MKSRRTTNGLTLAVRTALPALILSGCVTTTQFERPAAPTVTQYDVSAPAAQFGGGEAGPAQHLTAGDAGGIVNWWQRFNSPAINTIVQQALDANRTLAESAARVEQAQELVNAKAGTRLPQVDLTASAARQQFGEQQFGNLLGPGFEIPPFTAYGVGPNVRYTLDYTGGTARGIEQQQALAEYQQYQLAAARLAISGHAVLHALEIASIEEQMAAVEELLTRDRETLRLVRTANEAGSASGLDVISAESQLASDLTLLPPLRNALGIERRALAVVMGQMPAQAQIPALQLTQIALPEQLPLTVPSELARARPDILSAESQLHAATAALGVAEANLYPRITLSASVSQQAVEFKRLFDASKNAWSLAAGLGATLFDGGTLKAEKRAAAAALKASAASYEQTVLTAFAQVGDALQALQEDGEQMQAQSTAQASARETAELTRRAYEEGEIGIIQVLDAERRYQQARLGYVRALAARYRDTAQFFLAVGATG